MMNREILLRLCLTLFSLAQVGCMDQASSKETRTPSGVYFQPSPTIAPPVVIDQTEDPAATQLPVLIFSSNLLTIKKSETVTVSFRTQSKLSSGVLVSHSCMSGSLDGIVRGQSRILYPEVGSTMTLSMSRVSAASAPAELCKIQLRISSTEFYSLSVQFKYIPPPRAKPTCKVDQKECGFSHKSGYRESWAGRQVKCRMTYSRPNSGSETTAVEDFYSSCGTCRQAILQDHANSFNGSVGTMFSKSLRCQGKPKLDWQPMNQHTFVIETVEGEESDCVLDLEYFSFLTCTHS